MTWLTWRQHRALISGSAAAILVVALAMLVPGLWMHASFTGTGLEDCITRDRAQCRDLQQSFLSQFPLNFLIPIFLVVPALTGLFWGAPLVAREVEQGTHRLAWTQTVTRTHWMVIKLTLLGAAVVVGSGILTLYLSWWSYPLVTAANDGLDPGVFDLLGIAPVAYSLFAFALGVALGTVTRHTLLAMGLTLATFVVARAAVALVLRPTYKPALHLSYPLDAKQPIELSGAWLTSAQTVDSAGRLVSPNIGLRFDLVAKSCPSLQAPGHGLPDPGAMQRCIHEAGIHVVAAYQPADRYWLFQGIEGALFVALALGLVFLSIWWVRNRIS
jgi:hypothetical protein